MLAQASREDILYKYNYLMATVYCLLEFFINVHPHQSFFYAFFFANLVYKKNIFS